MLEQKIEELTKAINELIKVTRKEIIQVGAEDSDPIKEAKKRAKKFHLVPSPHFCRKFWEF